MSSHRVSSSPSPSSPLSERKPFGRRRPVWHAWIIPSSLQRLACCVRNVSNGGALLELDVPEWLPAQFEVFIEGPDMRLHCETVHRGKHGVGVIFSEADMAAELITYCNDRMDERLMANGGVAPPRLTSEMIKQALRRTRP